MNKKQNYTVPEVENVLVFPKEPVLDVASPFTLSAMTISGVEDIPAVENANYHADFSWD